jgi:hypothetical protein
VAAKATRAHEINALVRIVKTVSIVRATRIRISRLASQMTNIDVALKITSVLSVASQGIVLKVVPVNITRIQARRAPKAARRRPETRIETGNDLELESSQPEPLKTTVETTLTAVSTRLTMILDPKVSQKGPTSDEKTTRAPCQYRPGAGAYCSQNH